MYEALMWNGVIIFVLGGFFFLFTQRVYCIKQWSDKKRMEAIARDKIELDRIRIITSVKRIQNKASRITLDANNTKMCFEIQKQCDDILKVLNKC